MLFQQTFPILESSRTTGPDARYSYDSRALELMRAHLGRKSKPVVLELGPARAANLAMFSEYSGMVQIEDLRAIVCETPPKWDPEDIPNSTDRTAAVGWADLAPADLILCWDLFGYLSPLECDGIFAKLRQCFQPGALLLAHLTDRGKLNPPWTDGPLIFEVAGDKKFEMRREEAECRYFGCCGRGDINRVLPGAELRSALRLRNGIFELLYRLP